MLAANATDSDVVIFFESVRLRQAINEGTADFIAIRGRTKSHRPKAAGVKANTSMRLRSSEWKDDHAAVTRTRFHFGLGGFRQGEGMGKHGTGRPKCRSRGRQRDVRIWRGRSCRHACETLVYHFEPRKLPCGDSQH